MPTRQRYNKVFTIILRYGSVGYPQYGIGLPVIFAKMARGFGQKGPIGKNSVRNCTTSGGAPTPPPVVAS